MAALSSILIRQYEHTGRIADAINVPRPTKGGDPVNRAAYSQMQYLGAIADALDVDRPLPDALRWPGEPLKLPAAPAPAADTTEPEEPNDVA